MLGIPDRSSCNPDVHRILRGARRRSRPSGRKTAHRGLWTSAKPASRPTRSQLPIVSGKNSRCCTIPRRTPLLPQGNLYISPDVVCVGGGCPGHVTHTTAAPPLFAQEFMFGIDDEYVDPIEAAMRGERVTPEQLTRPYPTTPRVGVPPPRGSGPPPPPLWFQMLQVLEKLFGGGSNTAPPVLPGCPPGYLCT